MSSMRPLSSIVILVVACWCEKNTGNHVTRNTGNHVTRNIGNHVTRNDSHPRPCEQTYLCFNTTPICDTPTLTWRCKHYANSRNTKKEDRMVQSTTARPSTAAADCYTMSGRYHVYNGTMNVSRTGLPCKKWTDAQWKFHFLTGETKTEAGNSCRVGGKTRDCVSVPWCFVHTKKKWEFCEIQSCDSFSDTDCFTIAERNGKDTIVYNGTTSTTISGKTCKRWDLAKRGRKRSFSTGESITEVSNYCRVDMIDGLMVPWCYTATGWEVCNIRLCSGQNN